MRSALAVHPEETNQEVLMGVIIGVDPHNATHTAVAIGDDEAELDAMGVRATAKQTEQLRKWAANLSSRALSTRCSETCLVQYSPLITKNEPRIVPASFDLCRANLNELSSSGMFIPSESLKPTARFGLSPSSV